MTLSNKALAIVFATNVILLAVVASNITANYPTLAGQIFGSP